MTVTAACLVGALAEALVGPLAPGDKLADDEQEVLVRCHKGLCTPESGVSEPEARWVVTRLAELLSWPWPEFND